MDCTGLTSRDSKNCHASAYLEFSESCVDSAYLAHCRNCADCHHCIGCVGLLQAFHILNQPYEQAAYFEMMAKLRGELNLTLGECMSELPEPEMSLRASKRRNLMMVCWWFASGS